MEDKKLKKIVIKDKALKTVGTSAFKNISAKAVVKTPKGMKKEYTKLLKGKGQKKRKDKMIQNRNVSFPCIFGMIALQ